MNVAEAVGRTLGLTGNGVKSRLARGRAALEPLLRDHVTPAGGMGAIFGSLA